MFASNNVFLRGKETKTLDKFAKLKHIPELIDLFLGLNYAQKHFCGLLRRRKIVITFSKFKIF